MVQDLNAILDYVAELNELDTSGVAPLAQVSELEGPAARVPSARTGPGPHCERTAVMPRRPKPMAFSSKYRR